jgi:TonB family protein
LGHKDRRRARKANAMTSTISKVLFLSLTILLNFVGFDCCPTSCTKKTIEWQSYIPSQFEDNQTIINSIEFKELQKKYPISENLIDSLWETISPVFINWISNYDSVFQEESNLIVRFRIDSTSRVTLYRILNTFEVDTNRINILKEAMKDSRFSRTQNSRIAIEFTVNVNKNANSIKTSRSGPIYNVIQGRSKDEIMKIVNSNLKPMKQAFQSELNKDICAHGKITVRFALREDGTIPKCQIVESSYCVQNFENEIVRLVSNWNFLPILSTYDVTEVVYPFVFNKE